MRSPRSATCPDSVWAVVLAAGSGHRLADLARSAGATHVPKQYCSLFGGPTLLDGALARAARHAGDCRVLVVVAAEHEPWWRASQIQWDGIGCVVQPEDRGTAAGLYLALDTIRHVDPTALVLVLPADHHVEDERALSDAIDASLRHARRGRDVVLVGAEPEEADGELGWIVPERPGAALSRVAELREKPGVEADDLFRRGALVSTFVMAGRLRRWCALFRSAVPELTAAFVDSRDGVGYSGIPHRDLSRDVLARSTAALRVQRLPACGWSDLGVPSRLARVVDRAPKPTRFDPSPWPTPVLADLVRPATPGEDRAPTPRRRPARAAGSLPISPG